MATSYIPMVNNFYSLGAISASSTITFTLGNTCRLVIFVIGQSTRCQAMIILSTNASGQVTYSVRAADDNTYITVSSSANNKISISNGAGGINPNAYALAFSGTITRDAT